MVSGHLQVKKGFYYVVLSYYNNNGKRRVKYFSTGLPEKGNKRKAEAELARIRSEFVPPQEVGELASDMPFADYLLEWLEIVKVRVKATTFSSYEQMVKSVIEPYFRKKAVTLQGLEARHIQQFYSEKLKTVKPNSVIHYHAVIHQALKYAMKTDLVAQNVAMKVDRPKKNDYQPVFLDAEELQHLFEVVKGTKLELPVLVAAFYGLRRGEVCGLKWDAIDFERGTITIRHTVTSLQVDGKTKMYAQDSAKTKSSMCTLPLVDSFAEYFKEVKAAQEVNKKVCGNCYNYEYDGYVFVDELGDLMRPEYLTSYFPQYIQKHGCKRMRFHNLRHSCASFLPQTASAPSLFESLFLFCQSKKQALRPAFHSGGEQGIFFGALPCTFASLRSLTPSAKTVHRTVFFRRQVCSLLVRTLFLFCQCKKQALRPAFYSGGELGIFSVHSRAPSRRFAP